MSLSVPFRNGACKVELVRAIEAREEWHRSWPELIHHVDVGDTGRTWAWIRGDGRRVEVWDPSQGRYGRLAAWFLRDDAWDDGGDRLLTGVWKGGQWEMDDGWTRATRAMDVSQRHAGLRAWWDRQARWADHVGWSVTSTASPFPGGGPSPVLEMPSSMVPPPARTERVEWCGDGQVRRMDGSTLTVRVPRLQDWEMLLDYPGRVDVEIAWNGRLRVWDVTRVPSSDLGPTPDP